MTQPLDSQPARRRRAAKVFARITSRRDERGYVLAFSAIIIVPLMAISAMAIDIGAWYSEGSDMQKAADAASLAGVVWLPDNSTAISVAKETAKLNGYDDADPNITVTVTPLNTSELKVNIVDTDVPVYFSAFFMDSMTIERESVGTYVLPVPLGSPKNFFGTGSLASPSEGMWASINGWCAPKEQGDPFAVGYMGNWPSSGQQCPGSTTNPDYTGDDEDAYQYLINVPEGRTQPITVHLYSPQKDSSFPDSDNRSVSTRFRLWAADNTPFNDDDNPLVACAGYGESNPRWYTSSRDDDATFFGRSGWSRLCTIPTTSPAGKYVLGVRTLEGQSNSASLNNYSVMASYNSSGTQCDSRTESSTVLNKCPTVTGRNWISVYAAATSTRADFFLAEIGEEHAGKQMEITLFDPGEGGNNIQIRDPDGNSVQFDYRTLDGDYSGTNQTQLDVSGCNNLPQVGPDRASGCRYNERFVVLTVDLPPNYATLYPGEKWWKIRYDFNSSVTDRSTWSVRILGDPVHISR